MPCWAQATPPPAAADASVPVGTNKADVADVPVLLEGLGTVQAFNVVEIKAQVNGILTNLPVPEGTEVKQGDIVAEIDPRPIRRPWIRRRRREARTWPR